MQQITYKEYKDSKIEWIGKIPSHWKIKRIKQIAEYEIGGTPPREKQEYFEGDNLWVSIADLNGKKIVNDTYEKITLEGIKDSNCKKIPKDSLLFSFKLSVGLLAFAGRELYTNEAIASFLTKSKANLNYLFYTLQNGFENNARENIYGAKLFNQRSINDAKVQFPENLEQEKIADFLDKYILKIETVIKNKITQVNLLKEYERIIINEMHILEEKYPKSRLKFYVNTTKGFAFKSEQFIDEGIKIIKASDIKENTLVSNTDCFISKELAPQYDEVKLHYGDILMSTVGSWPWVKNSAVGQIAVVPKDCDGSLLNQNTVRLEPEEKRLDKSFFSYFLISDKYRSYLDVGAHGTANQASLDLRYILDYYLLKIPFVEQRKIAQHLDEKTSKIRKSIELIEMEVEKLEEYKKILINDAVTGKIKIF